MLQRMQLCIVEKFKEESPDEYHDVMDYPVSLDLTDDFVYIEVLAFNFEYLV